VKTRFLIGAGAAALASISAPALAQMQMPGMQMPMKMPSKKAAAKKAAERKKAAVKQVSRIKGGRKTPAARHSKPSHAGGISMQMPADAEPNGTMSMPMPPNNPPSAPEMTMPMGQQQPQADMPMPMPPANAPSAAPVPMSMGNHPSAGAASGGMAMPLSGMQAGKHGGDSMMTGALGSYVEQRESSGTAWQPDSATPMSGPMSMTGNWMLMAHGTANLVYDHQSGLRGTDKTFVNGMLMAMARHPLGDGMMQFRAMLSPDPLMGPAGYPLLLATGETANGRTPLVDRQHPHDFFMELSTSISQNIGPKRSVFLYAGLPGEPAFGPPAFMHRESILDSPEAPIAHHWLDSTHISFGVVTAGMVLDRLKIEASRFNAREPDQHRWNIETGPLDSTSVRVSWNPTRTLALQGSWAHFKDPEQLEPGVNQKRWSASALWADDVAPGWHTAATLAWGRKSSEGHNDDGVAAEVSIKHSGWTVFGRGEWVENRELLGLVDSPAFKVGKVSLGAVRDFQLAHHLSLGAGGLFSLNFVADRLAAVYGSNDPTGMMAFLRLKLN
jgi:hypothetical protein